MIQAFAPLAEWTYRSREQKRSVLSTLVPEIRVADYKIESLGLNPPMLGNEDSRKGKDNFIAERPSLLADDGIVTNCSYDAGNRSRRKLPEQNAIVDGKALEPAAPWSRIQGSKEARVIPKKPEWHLKRLFG